MIYFFFIFIWFLLNFLCSILSYKYPMIFVPMDDDRSCSYDHFFILDIVPPEQVIDIGRQARLECLTEERDRASIIWRKDGDIISPSSNIVQVRGEVSRLWTMSAKIGKGEGQSLHQWRKDGNIILSSSNIKTKIYRKIYLTNNFKSFTDIS